MHTVLEMVNLCIYLYHKHFRIHSWLFKKLYLISSLNQMPFNMQSFLLKILIIFYNASYICTVLTLYKQIQNLNQISEAERRKHAFLQSDESGERKTRYQAILVVRPSYIYNVRRSETSHVLTLFRKLLFTYAAMLVIWLLKISQNTDPATELVCRGPLPLISVRFSFTYFSFQFSSLPFTYCMCNANFIDTVYPTCDLFLLTLNGTHTVLNLNSLLKCNLCQFCYTF